jgi:hypothetical protein
MEASENNIGTEGSQQTNLLAEDQVEGNMLSMRTGAAPEAASTARYGVMFLSPSTDQNLLEEGGD